jgi:hypothetical protein
MKIELKVAWPEGVVETFVVPLSVPDEPGEIVTVTSTPDVVRLFEDGSLSWITAG